MKKKSGFTAVCAAMGYSVKSIGTRLALLLGVILFSVMSLVAWLGVRHQAEMLQHEETRKPKHSPPHSLTTCTY